MCRRCVFTIFAVAALSGCPKKEEKPVVPTEKGQAAPAPAAKAPLRVEAAGLATPESVLYDAKLDLYLVSNINGKPLDADGNGFISRVSPTGEVTALKWIDGAKEGVTLNAPKGMALTGDLLYVADITHVRIFDRQSGAPRGEVAIPGGTFVNDLVAAKGGVVYASDSGAGSAAIWKITGPPDKARAEALVKGEELGRPNGVTLDGDELVVVTMGSGELYRVTPDGKRAKVVKAPKGALDGVERLEDGSFLVSSWEAKTVYRVGADGAFKPLVEGVESPADIGYDSKRKRVLIPLFNQHKLLIQPL